MPVNIDESPIARFVRNITSMGACRADLIPLAAELGNQDQWRVALEDIAMLTQERVVVGLRTKWVRRVCVPMVQAWRALHAEGNDHLAKAKNASLILQQLKGHDDDLIDVSSLWLQTNYF